MANAPKKLTSKEINRFLKKNPDWKVNKRETHLSKTFSFSDYVQGLIFIARISVHAEVTNHHPDLTLSYGKVKVEMSTHEVKGLTKRDIELAGKIDKLYK